MENRFAGIDERINAQDLKLDQIMMILKKMETHSGKEKEGNMTSVGDRIQSKGRSLNFNPKLEFPRFDGSNTRNWIKKAGKYFNLCKIPEDQWVDIASLYMIDKAENWMSSYLSFRKFVSWHEFIIDLSARFRDDKGHNVVEQFKKLEQKGSLEDYIDEFEDLRSVLVQNNQYLPDSYILDCFIGGLKASISLYVKAFKPNCLANTIEYARLKEESLEVEHARYTKFQKPPAYNSSKPPLLPTPQTKAANFPPNKGFKYIHADVRAEKIAKGLCYYCGIGEGQSTSRPPLFDGTNYSYWKERMRIYIRSTNFQLWLVIKNGEEIPMKKVGETTVPKTEDEFDAEDIKKVENYAKAINMLYCAVNPDDYRKISCCTTAKEMWDKLEVTYEGTDQAKHGKDKPGFKKQRAYISWGGDSGDESTDQEEDEAANLCLMAHEDQSDDVQEASSVLWYLDSGCSKHMTGDASKFLQIKPAKGGNVVFGDNSKGKIIGVGSVGKSDFSSIDNVLLVKGLKHNLLSISQLCDKGNRVTFDSKSCTVERLSDNKLKPFRGTLPTAVHIPEWFQGQVAGTHPKPAAIIDGRIQKVQNKAQVQYLVQWEGKAFQLTVEDLAQHLGLYTLEEMMAQEFHDAPFLLPEDVDHADFWVEHSTDPVCFDTTGREANVAVFVAQFLYSQSLRNQTHIVCGFVVTILFWSLVGSAPIMRDLDAGMLRNAHIRRRLDSSSSESRATPPPPLRLRRHEHLPRLCPGESLVAAPPPLKPMQPLLRRI
ncbi:unnamed protein product [Cuscuta campestris]|uniref:Uncharacterized protein n=1 Tax=Cuscuta campestris TaxID=132261 RepID=A0A484L9C4_9ASTE|nr:unnamed protein product [Cuscuta campestris]